MSLEEEMNSMSPVILSLDLLEYIQERVPENEVLSVISNIFVFQCILSRISESEFHKVCSLLSLDYGRCRKMVEDATGIKL